MFELLSFLSPQSKLLRFLKTQLNWDPFMKLAAFLSRTSLLPLSPISYHSTPCVIVFANEAWGLQGQDLLIGFCMLCAVHSAWSRLSSLHTGFERVEAFSESQGQCDWASQLTHLTPPTEWSINVYSQKSIDDLKKFQVVFSCRDRKVGWERNLMGEKHVVRWISVFLQFAVSRSAILTAF